MSYFPPPPPAPPPAQDYPPQNYKARGTGFRGRGNVGQRAWGGGAHSRGGPHPRGRGGYSRGPRRYGGQSDDRNGVDRRSFQQHGQTQQSSPNYMPPPPYGQGEAGNFSQQADWGVHLASSTQTPPSQAPPIRIGFNPLTGGIHSEPYQPSQELQQFPQIGGFVNDYSSHGYHGLPQPFDGSQSAPPPPRGRGHKRGFNEAFGQRGGRKGHPGYRTAPAVPQFGGPLPLPPKPPAIENEENRSKNDKRKNNKLGLTPKVAPDSADETEDDENEETRLAAHGASESNQSQPLQIMYRGQTSTLRSASDIAAWIAERRKRYPTKVRAAEAAERKRQLQEARKAARESQQAARAKAIAEAKEKREQKVEDDKKKKKNKKDKVAKEQKGTSEDAAAKARRKVEDLRRRLEKEERRIVKAEAKISESAKKGSISSQGPVTDQTTNSNKRKRSASPNYTDQLQSIPPFSINEAPIPSGSQSVQGAAHSSATAPDPLTPTSQPRDPTEASTLSHNPTAPSVTLAEAPSTPSSTLSSSTPTSEDDDETSSSGLSTDSDSSAAPSESTTKRLRPERVPPPLRGSQKKGRLPCRDFVKTGYCRRGNKCRFKHELPDRGGAKKGKAGGVVGGAERGQGKRGRVGLWERLVEQEVRNEVAERKRRAREEGEGGGEVVAR